MNGDEATRRIHADQTLTLKPRVVMVTAYGREDVLRLAEQAGVDGFLIKPVSPSILLDTILSVLGRGRVLGVAERRRRLNGDSVVSGRLAGVRLLLVEDNDINREFAGELLRSEGVEVDEAVNGEEALSRVQERDYDAVLMDIQMPVLDGLEAARRIRALADQPDGRRFARLPIIAMTALAMARDAEQSRAAGMNDHVSKPIDPDQLLAALAHWIQRPAAGSSADESGGELRLGRPRQEPADLPPELLALTSLDAREGVRRIGGKVAAYCRQLARFRERYAGALVELRRLLREEGAAAAEEHCHALKGVVGNLGARELYRQINVLDDELKKGQPPVESALAAAEQLLGQLLAEIDSLAVAAAEPPPAAEPLTSQELGELLRALLRALEYDLGAAEPLVQKLRAGTATGPLNAEIIAVARAVELFDTDRARALVQQLLATIGEDLNDE